MEPKALNPCFAMTTALFCNDYNNKKKKEVFQALAMQVIFVLSAL